MQEQLEIDEKLDSEDIIDLLEDRTGEVENPSKRSKLFGMPWETVRTMDGAIIQTMKHNTPEQGTPHENYVGVTAENLYERSKVLEKDSWSQAFFEQGNYSVLQTLGPASGAWTGYAIGEHLTHPEIPMHLLGAVAGTAVGALHASEGLPRAIDYSNSREQQSEVYREAALAVEKGEKQIPQEFQYQEDPLPFELITLSDPRPLGEKFHHYHVDQDSMEWQEETYGSPIIESAKKISEKYLDR
ncbi:hypothetical protein [Candidatus Nanohalococcus occultus]|uniref:hypothetical protein n=1 Tax=Candidatus Nanohalococcus occultus TaxID=2978047 RepID=UPI0039E1C798